MHFRVMVFSGLCGPNSRVRLLRWLPTVSIPGVDTARLTYQQLLRSMDAVMDYLDAVNECVVDLLRPLIDDDLSLSSTISRVRHQTRSEPDFGDLESIKSIV